MWFWWNSQRKLQIKWEKISKLFHSIESNLCSASLNFNIYHQFGSNACFYPSIYPYFAWIIWLKIFIEVSFSPQRWHNSHSYARPDNCCHTYTYINSIIFFTVYTLYVLLLLCTDDCYACAVCAPFVVCQARPFI